MIKLEEQGRSMVEMLGVLAVMGVLSVGGVAMYTSTMNKYRANEILNEASKRAVMVAGQLLTNPNETTMSLAQFGSNAVAGATFKNDAAISNGKITLTFETAPDESICNQMIAATGTNSAMQVAPGCGTITFNADMSKEGTPASASSPVDCSTDADACSGCQTCQNGVCVDTQSACSAGTCTDGSCHCSDNRVICGMQCCTEGTFCARIGINPNNYTCATPTGGDCTKNSDCPSGKYCKMGNDYNCSPKNGKCTATTSDDLIPISWNSKTFYASTESMNWWTAENFCLAHGKKLASLGSLGLSRNYNRETFCSKWSYYCDDTGEMVTSCDECDDCWEDSCLESDSPMSTAFNAAGVANRNSWTSNKVNSCGARVVEMLGSLEHTNASGLTFTNYALCE